MADKIIIAKASFVTTSPRKLRLVAAALRNAPLPKIVDQLRMLPQRAARELLQVVEQAIGNAKASANLSPADLKLDSMQVGEGPRFKRRDAHAHGARFDSGVRRRRMAHILVKLTTIK